MKIHRGWLSLLPAQGIRNRQLGQERHLMQAQRCPVESKILVGPQTREPRFSSESELTVFANRTFRQTQGVSEQGKVT